MTIKKEAYIIRVGVVAYWFLFWLFNTADKFLTDTFLWLGRDRLSQFTDYFQSIGVTHLGVSFFFLALITLLEFIAFAFLALALWNILTKKGKSADDAFFWGTLTGLIIFSIFSIGDQAFGDRFELLEHTIYWISLIISWGAYTYFPKIK